MIRVVGHWDIWETPEVEYNIHWRHLMRHFGVECLTMVPTTPWQKQPQVGDTQLCESDDLAAVVADAVAAGLTPVILDENGATSIVDFVHPANPVYILGRTGVSALETLGPGYASVHIPTFNGTPQPLLQPAQACALVLYDRLVKSWQ